MISRQEAIIGKKKTKTEQTNKPVFGQVEATANDQLATYNQSKPMIGQVSSNLGQVSNDLFAQFRQGDPTIQMAQQTTQDMMQGGDNPYIDQMLDISNNRVQNQMGARLARTGNSGGSDYTNLITRALAENETGTRFNQFNQTQDRRLQAAGMAPGLLAGSYLPLQMAQQTGQAGAMLPLQASLANSAGVGGLLGQYQNTKGTQTQSGMSWGEMLGAGMQAASLFSDRRLKTDIRRVGTTDAGVPIYTYRYLGDGPFHMGVMADDVPQAAGPVIEGFATVRYEAVA